MLTIDTMSSEVINSLPGIVRDVITHFGSDKAGNLINKLGGRTYYVAEGKTAKGKEKRKQLAEVIGVDVEEFINARYQGKEIYIPRMKKLETLARNNRIKVRAEELLGEGKSMKSIVSQLAKDFSLCERTLWLFLKQPLSPASEGA
ncbi:TPA: hypothetical protein L5Y86_002909 [Pseudomonas aeruginosa]|uniref:Mor transcription activator family protein n=1 Tax=Pseudomonas aeruginosa TaxID=287 RepID=UPI00159CD79D|nr:Mor transcription activator family protein [Pseudomonas aeruginosa]QKZ82152.1 hypothetical protein HWN47_11730 [Pseudomonas aeruginosa]HBP2366935.1 hypothetical protein [Pseudomonas aeruginosa]HBP2409008.1 hypothetical protein [Pseudomonas aeruginosa]HBP2416145.1 hypothetical protein [Pseudomonas aeruginosa]HBP2422914.1 hypothetical protein [Pseudomonas aeruginosa]